MKKPQVDFREDPRYKQANKEALITIGVFILNFIWWYVFAYWMGSKSPDQYSYVMGFPAWFFYSSILGYFVFSFLIWFIVEKVFVNIPLGKTNEDN